MKKCESKAEKPLEQDRKKGAGRASGQRTQHQFPLLRRQDGDIDRFDVDPLGGNDPRVLIDFQVTRLRPPIAFVMYMFRHLPLPASEEQHIRTLSQGILSQDR